MRVHRVVLQAGRAALAEEERKMKQDVFDDKLTTGMTATKHFLTGLDSMKNVNFGKDKALENQKKWLYDTDPKTYAAIYGPGKPGESDGPNTFLGGLLGNRSQNKGGITYRTPDGDFNPNDYGSTEDFLASVEGFSPKAYWDVNAFRVGFGTDTLVNAKGDSSKVKRRTRITEEEAIRNLGINLDKTFRAELRNKFGAETYDALPDGVKIGLESLAYNAGSDLNDKDGKLKEAIISGDYNKAADLIAGQVDKDSELYGRRQKEASFLRGYTNKQRTDIINSQKENPLDLDATEEDIAKRNDIMKKYNLTEDDFTEDKPPSWWEENILAPANQWTLDNVFGMTQEEYDMFVENNLVTTDAGGEVVLHPKIYEKLNGMIDQSVQFFRESKLGRMVGEYQDIVGEPETVTTSQDIDNLELDISSLNDSNPETRDGSLGQDLEYLLRTGYTQEQAIALLEERINKSNNSNNEPIQALIEKYSEGY